MTITKVWKLDLMQKMINPGSVPMPSNYIIFPNNKIKEIRGNEYYWGHYSNTYDPFYYSDSNHVLKTAAITDYSSQNNGGIYIGTGTGVPSEDDYDLFNRIALSSNWTSTISSSYTFEQNKATFIDLITLTNSSDQAYTITEIGYISTHYYRTTPDGSATRNRTFLFEHDMLADPLTLAAGETGVIEWKREFDFTNFSPVI